MSSARPRVSRENVYGGMDRYSPSHLIPEEKWRTLFNVDTRLVQVPRKKILQQVYNGHPHAVTVLAPLPSGYLDYSLILALTQSSAFQVQGATSVRLTKNGSNVSFNVNDYERWSTASYNNFLFFCNSSNDVHYTDGCLVKSLSNAPRGTYVEAFFDHLVIGRPIYNGELNDCGVRWSHLKDFEQWVPGTDSEADSYYCTETQNGRNTIRGVTGVSKLGDRCLIYTADCVYAMQYVGLPRVMRTDPWISGIGCGFKYGLVSNGKTHFFPDWNNRTFVKLSEEGVEDIGLPIRDFVVENLTTDAEYAQRLWGYIDEARQEVVWVFVSKTSSEGRFDRFVAYNYVTKGWYCGSCEDWHSFCPATRRARSVSELTGQVSTYTERAVALSKSSDTFLSMWGSRNGVILQQESSSDSVAVLLTQEQPYAETKDFVYSTISKENDVLGVFLNSSYTEALGVEVLTALRGSLADAVAWMSVGVWTPERRNNLLPFSKNGTVIRYRFQPKVVSTSTSLMQIGISNAAVDGIATFSLRSQLHCDIAIGGGNEVCRVGYDELGNDLPYYATSSIGPLGVNANTLYTIPVRVRAATNLKGNFTGGVPAGDYGLWNPSEVNRGVWDEIRLEGMKDDPAGVTTSRLYLNRHPTDTSGWNFGFDYVVNLSFYGGTYLTLKYDSIDGYFYHYGQDSQLVNVSGLGTYDGVFVQVDYTPDSVGGVPTEGSVTTYSTSSGVRGWQLFAWAEELHAGGAAQ